MTSLTSPISSSRPSFLDAPRCPALDRLDADITVLGIPFTTPHDLASSRSPASAAPAALREQSRRYAGQIAHYDFDLGGPLFGGQDLRLVDAGDVRAVPGRYEQNAQRAVGALEAIVERGGLPIVLGGDRAAALPLVRALAAQGSLGIVHFGAELDWRDDVEGVRDAAPSTMRRVAELRGVTSMMQVGLRGSGHARPADVEDARHHGTVVVRADDVHDAGAAEVLRHLPATPRYAVCLDIAAIDPSVAPGVESPAFGGLTYFQVTSLLRGIVARGPIAGLALTGVVPTCDFHDRTSLLGARLIVTLIGALAHAGRFGTTQPSSPLTTARELATAGARA